MSRRELMRRGIIGGIAIISGGSLSAEPYLRRRGDAEIVRDVKSSPLYHNVPEETSQVIEQQIRDTQHPLSPELRKAYDMAEGWTKETDDEIARRQRTTWKSVARGGLELFEGCTALFSTWIAVFTNSTPDGEKAVPKPPPVTYPKTTEPLNWQKPKRGSNASEKKEKLEGSKS